MQNNQTMLIDKLITCCKEVSIASSSSLVLVLMDEQPNAERTQRLFASLREELEKRGKVSDSNGAGS